MTKVILVFSLLLAFTSIGLCFDNPDGKNAYFQFTCFPHFSQGNRWIGIAGNPNLTLSQPYHSKIYLSQISFNLPYEFLTFQLGYETYSSTLSGFETDYLGWSKIQLDGAYWFFSIKIYLIH